MIEALVLGLSGSMHCVAMCGPLHLAATGNHKHLWFRIIFNLGRIITYVVLGLLIGQVGRFIPLFEAQQVVSILTGIAIWIVYFVPKITGKEWQIGALNRFVVKTMGKLMKTNAAKSKSVAGYIAMGMLNGLLPCGLVYAALIGALAQASTMGSVLYMTLFGLGTVPVLFFIAAMGDKIKAFSNEYPYWKHITAFVVFVIGLLFILRGLNLGIPFISPQNLDLLQNGSDVNCH